MADLNPPIGARVRITTTWPQGTVVAHEGIFTGWHEPDWELDGHFRTPYSEAGWMNSFRKSGEDPTVTVEILELPAPEEPPNGTVLQETGTGWVWRHDYSEEFGDKHWWSDGDDQGHTWTEVCDRLKASFVGSFVRLVPAPVVKLPWSLGSCQMTATVDASGNGFIDLTVGNGPYTADEVEQIAAALLSAAREVAR
jgi:hypothetical protein